MRSILLVLTCATTSLLAQSAAQYLPLTPDGKGDLSGVWVVQGSGDLPGEVPYRPEALKLWQERKANLAKDDPAGYCLPNGVVRMTKLPYKIVQTPQLIVVLSEGNTHSFRRFFLDGRAHNLDLEPNSWTGDSIGKWEGETLVVDTIGFNDRTWLDDTGKPHSDAMHVIERYRRPDPGHLQIQYTIEDPKSLTKPYTFTRIFVPANREIQERFCTEQNHLVGK
ncbi:MAG: hypothetical protein JWO19_3158 [Bryobacterales bacterium]|nr:hypothetical protein [Bryobacterales bacterium]